MRSRVRRVYTAAPALRRGPMILFVVSHQEIADVENQVASAPIAYGQLMAAAEAIELGNADSCLLYTSDAADE